MHGMAFSNLAQFSYELEAVTEINWFAEFG